jgi:DNA-directed RNA polymerase subunit omega
MLKFSVNDLVKNNENCYSFVVAIAKRARIIAEKAGDDGALLYEKPVQLAVKDYIAGKFHIVPAKIKVKEEKINILDEDYLL